MLWKQASHAVVGRDTIMNTKIYLHAGWHADQHGRFLNSLSLCPVFRWLSLTQDLCIPTHADRSGTLTVGTMASKFYFCRLMTGKQRFQQGVLLERMAICAHGILLEKYAGG